METKKKYVDKEGKEASKEWEKVKTKSKKEEIGQKKE